uniref:Alpha-macroglobulin receptor-binding domain-containing protein n=1 Tax=Mola mola TaxID=94237 RepID=A0A3Q3XBL7_MOLML
MSSITCVMWGWILILDKETNKHVIWGSSMEYMVAIPAILESGEKTQFCSSLLDPKETMTMTVTLRDKDMNMTLCFGRLEKEKVLLMEVEVKGDTFYSKEARKVMIRIYKPMTFIQTDKPIYLPGQTGNKQQPSQSSDYTLTPLIGNEYSSCLCANQRLTVSWTMVPSVLGDMKVSVTAEAVASDISCNNEIVLVPERGRIDVVTRTLIVKAEGVETTQTYNWLLCPKGSDLAEEVEIKLPDNVIEGSARASVSVLGDIMGRSLQHLDGLLRMPYGCGEQNMALLAPNIYILDYLENTNQLTPEIEEKAIGYLLSGYQRQLNYQNSDGAYTTFGSGPGNSWLTAFVLRTFAKAKKYIYIDPAIMQKSETWLSNKQRENGCFEMVGKLVNKRMKGGVSDEVTLTAYITAAFLEMNISDPRMNKSLSCLRASSYFRNTYTTALMAYTFTLAGDMDNHDMHLNHLDTFAINKGGYLYWDQTPEEKSAPLSVEISAYVILAILSASPTAGDLGYATRIVRWLTTQQNYYGGFSSTQDTVVALQALALYSSLVYSTDGSSTVTVKSATEAFEFTVNDKNKLLFQEKEMKYVAGKYELEATGSACASVQVSPPSNTSCFPRCAFTYDNSSNMLVLDIKLLSGFSPAPVSGKLLKNGEPMKYSLDLLQDYPVQNLKPAVVKIYDYYEPSNADTLFHAKPYL